MLCDPRLLICYPLSQQKTSLEFYIDIHAHSTMMNGFMYGNVFEDEERFQRQAIFPKLLCQNAEDFSYVSQSSLQPGPASPSPLPLASLSLSPSEQMGLTCTEHQLCTRSWVGDKDRGNKLCLPSGHSSPVGRETLKWQRALGLSEELACV